MPATSKAQRKLMAIAEHHPEEVSDKNKGVLGMNKDQLHDFAATKEKGKPEHVGRGKSSKHSPFGRKPNARGGY